jgi:hypothetical protein
MSRISGQALVSAAARVRAMDLRQKEQLSDELFRAQPRVFATFLVQQRLGVSLAKADFLLDILLVGFQAMKESGLSWPLITEDQQDAQMGRLVATVQLGDVRGALRDHALQQYVETHPERDLLAFVQVETANWLQRVVPEESDKFVVMAVLNLVDCIASVPLPAETNPVPCTQGQADAGRALEPVMT